MSDKLIYWGATGQTIVLHDFLSEKFKVIAVFDQSTQVKSPFEKVPIYYTKDGFINWINQNNENRDTNFLVGIGGAKGYDRIQISEMLKSHGLTSITAIHPSAVISKTAIISEGNQVLMGACVGAKAEIGKHVIVNSNASIDHECIIGNGCHIGPGATLAGCVETGDYSFVGTGAIILPRLKIGSNTIIGAGSVVTKNIPNNVVAYGNPARIIKDNGN